MSSTADELRDWADYMASFVVDKDKDVALLRRAADELDAATPVVDAAIAWEDDDNWDFDDGPRRVCDALSAAVCTWSATHGGELG